MPEHDGWNYSGTPQDGDSRKLVTLVDDGMMTWVGIRMFSQAEKRWMNGSDPERAQVKAWRDLLEPAKGYWSRGQLYVPRPPQAGG